MMPKIHEGDLRETVHAGGKILWLRECDQAAGIRQSVQSASHTQLSYFVRAGFFCGPADRLSCDHFFGEDWEPVSFFPCR